MRRQFMSTDLNNDSNKTNVKGLPNSTLTTVFLIDEKLLSL